MIIRMNDNDDTQSKTSVAESAAFVKRLSDGILAVLIALTCWGGYYIQTLAVDIRVMHDQIVVLNQRIERDYVIIESLTDSMETRLVTRDSIADVMRRVGELENNLKDHVERPSHHGTERDLVAINTTMKIMMDVLNKLVDQHKK